MNGTIYISGEIGVDTTLLDVIKQVKNQPQATSFLLRLDSVGGFVTAGDDIYSYLKNLSQPITVFATKAYSIASKILMAGDTRILVEGATDVVMIHLPWMEVAGSHNEITSHLKDLKATEDGLVKFYAEALQIDQTTIQSLLTNETFLNAEQALQLGFATQLQATQKAVARYNNKEEKEEESLMNKFSKKIDAIYNKMMGIKNELVLQDATGVEIVFPDLTEGDMPLVDGKANVDGKAADGEFLMPDGSKIIIAGGIVTEIQPAEETPEEEVLDAEGDELPAEETPDDRDAMIAELEAKIAELEAKLADTDAQDKMLSVLEMSVEKANQMEAKFEALAKQIGSDFNPSTTKENQPNVKAKTETPTSRAWQILNS